MLHSDVLVVGSGSAGSIVAEILSADPACDVTLVEAGPGLADPALAAQAANGTKLPIGAGSRLVRRYRAELTSAAERTVTIMRGSTIGGSGAVNGGYFCRGLPSDFAGYPGEWRWPQILESFRSVETDLDFDGPQHGQSGPIRVRRSSEFCTGTEQFIVQAQSTGFGWIEDLNDATVTKGSGAGAVPLNIVDGVRAGPGAVYLEPAIDRGNLTVLTETRAVRVEIQGDRAVAVRAIGAQGPVRLSARRIILCAGAIGSAQLLMLSGIGDEAMLRRVGIAVRSPLPVGAQCADHPEWLIAAPWQGTTNRPVLEVVLHHENLEIRPYTSGFAAMVGNDEHIDPPHIGIALMSPQSRGRISLMSTDPQVAPRIEYRYDSEPDDLMALRHGVELVSQMVKMRIADSGQLWSTSQHLCGSAPMGPDDDPSAVLDAQCRVRGVEGLWVIDGSALPRITSRGPHATIAMLAHRAAMLMRDQDRSR